MQTHHTTRRSTALKNEIGNRYGRLTVIEQAPAPEHYKEKRQGFWLCRCDCGNVAVVNGSLLRRGGKQSCGCYNRDSHMRADAVTRMSEYRIWHHVKRRCHDPKNDRYSIYGGRGITMCARWRESFKAFLEDVGPRPSPLHTIDRLDVNGNYEPGNVRWATLEEQANNKRNSIHLAYGGKTMTLAQWSRETGIPKHIILKRYHSGLPPEEILQPVT